jgi:tetratricopeptide (TPR) repeat protein
MENEVLQKYLEKLIHLQEHSSERFTEDNFRIAIDSLGLSKKEIEDLDKEFDEQFKRGSNYYRSHNYDKAIAHLETALHLEPFHLAAMMLLTDAYKLRYLENYNKEDYHKTINLCKRGLSLQAFNPYFAKVETLAEKCEAAHKNRNNRYLMAFGLGGLLGLGILSVFLMAWASSTILVSAAAVLALLVAFSSFPAMRQFQKLRLQLKKATITLKFVSKR